MCIKPRLIFNQEDKKEMPSATPLYALLGRMQKSVPVSNRACHLGLVKCPSQISDQLYEVSSPVLQQHSCINGAVRFCQEIA